MTGPSMLKAVNSRPGWYGGDFQVQTSASDEIISPARWSKLDLIAITDHGTIEAFSELDENLDFLVVPGIEITLDDGEFNVFDLEGWCEWGNH